jgi:hypothetical protein
MKQPKRKRIAAAARPSVTSTARSRAGVFAGLQLTFLPAVEGRATLAPDSRSS